MLNCIGFHLGPRRVFWASRSVRKYAVYVSCSSNLSCFGPPRSVYKPPASPLKSPIQRWHPKFLPLLPPLSHLQRRPPRPPSPTLTPSQSTDSPTALRSNTANPQSTEATHTQTRHFPTSTSRCHARRTRDRTLHHTRLFTQSLQAPTSRAIEVADAPEFPRQTRYPPKS